MTTKTINIAGKEVTLAYCYATEIAFRKYTGVSIDNFEAANPEHTLYLILSCIVAWCEAKGEEPAVKDEELMYHARPKEIVEALTVIYKLRAEWYEVPAGEPNDEGKNLEDEKNA
jgi:hypothetical protein